MSLDDVKETEDADELKNFDDALYIQRLLTIFKSKDQEYVPELSTIQKAQMEIMRKRNIRPITPKKGYEMLLEAPIGNARYKLTNKFKSLSTPRY